MRGWRTGWTASSTASSTAAVLLAVLVGWVGACGEAPGEQPLRLAPGTLAALEGRPSEAQGLQELLDRGFGNMLDPRWPEGLALALEGRGVRPQAPGLGLMEPELAELVRRDNRARQRAFLGELEAGGVPRRMPRGLEHLGPLLEQVRAEGDTQGDPGGTARAALVEAVLGAVPDAAAGGRLYALQCFACHGREGGGDGPTAQSLHPRPRDFRAGEFAHHRSRRPVPAQGELVEIVHRGLPGTGMNAFRGLSAAEKSALADHVRRLAVRGEVERRLLADLEAGRRLDMARLVAHTAEALEPWIDSQRQAAPGAASGPDGPSEPQRP